MADREIVLRDDRTNENCIEWLTGQKTATYTLSQTKYVNRAKKFAEEYPDEVQIMAENPDGSVVLHFPLSWLKFSPPRKMSDELKEINGKRLQEYRASKASEG